MTRICCWILLIGAGLWGVVLLPFCLTPAVAVFLPGYVITAAYVMYLRKSHQWAFLKRFRLWCGSLVVHGVWLCLHLYEVAHDRLSLHSPAGTWWLFAVAVSGIGMLAEVTESLAEEMPAMERELVVDSSTIAGVHHSRESTSGWSTSGDHGNR